MKTFTYLSRLYENLSLLFGFHLNCQRATVKNGISVDNAVPKKRISIPAHLQIPGDENQRQKLPSSITLAHLSVNMSGMIGLFKNGCHRHVNFFLFFFFLSFFLSGSNATILEHSCFQIQVLCLSVSLSPSLFLSVCLSV